MVVTMTAHFRVPLLRVDMAFHPRDHSREASSLFHVIYR